MILLADAVVDPRAVMVVPLNAVVAGRAVSGTRSPDDHTFWAKMNGINHLHEFLF